MIRTRRSMATRPGTRAASAPPVLAPRAVPASAPVVGRLALLGAVAVATVAPAVPSPASAASPSCPKAGRTLATSRSDDGSSRVWRTRRGIYACTTIDAAGRPDSWLLSRSTVGRLRLDGDTVAFTQHAGGTPRTARRVTAIDLTSGQRFLRRQKAIPVADVEGAREHEGSVEELRVLTGGYVGWIANGSTVVIGAAEPDDVAIAGEDEATSEIYLSSNNEGSQSDGYTGIARRYASTPAVARSLHTSLSIADTGSDPEDDGSYATTWSWSPDGTTTVQAVMTGNR
jgi:WD40 repeat protein